MSKLNDKQKYDAEEILKDVNTILDILNKFEKTPLDKTDTIIKDLNIKTKNLEKKYIKKNLDSKK